MDNLDLTKYIDMALRRKWWIIIPFLLTILAGLTYALNARKVYQAETLILVQPQKVPQNFVRSIVSTSIEDRLRTITQQVTSRTNLEQIIDKYHLYPYKDMLLDQKVQLLRKNIDIQVVRGGRGGDAFRIIFKYEDPRIVMEVTNALASNFISQNLKIRESQALGTSTFLKDELESARKRLGEKDELIKRYRLKHMGAMPENLQTNLNILGKIQNELDNLNESLRDAQNRKLIIQRQINDMKNMKSLSGSALVESSPLLSTPATEPLEAEAQSDLIELKKKLAMLQSRYTENHPDVKRLKKMIEKMEAEGSKTMPEDQVDSKEDITAPQIELPGATDFLKPQLEQIDLEITNLKSEITKLSRKAKLYERRIEETPQREQELLSLNRDYDNLKGIYDSLLQRKLEADIAVSMEKKQKGEQFRVVDPAKLPQRPIKPDVRKILLIALVLGLGLGGGLGYVIEMFDTSYKNPEEVEKELGLPVLVSLPIRYTEKEIRKMKLRSILAYASVSVGFVAAACAIVIAAKGLDKTLEFVN